MKDKLNTLKIDVTETWTQGSKQKVWNVNHYTMKPDWKQIIYKPVIIPSRKPFLYPSSLT